MNSYRSEQKRKERLKGKIDFERVGEFGFEHDKYYFQMDYLSRAYRDGFNEAMEESYLNKKRLQDETEEKRQEEVRKASRRREARELEKREEENREEEYWKTLT